MKALALLDMRKRPSTRVRVAAALAAIGLLALSAARAAPDTPAMAEPQALVTSAPPRLPLGCRSRASELLCNPSTDSHALRALPAGWADSNPYRGDTAAADIGHRLFNETCALCHGENADGNRVPAPDLRRLAVFCTRIDDAALRQRCDRDVDAYFLKTVRLGRQTIGITHMPPWEGVLTQEQMWAIRTYVESGPPR